MLTIRYRAQLLLTEPSWGAALASEFSKPYFKKLEAFLEAEAKTCNIFPAPENIFRQARVFGSADLAGHTLSKHTVKSLP